MRTILVALAALLICGSAYAQAPNTTVDFAPVISEALTWAVSLVGMVISALLAWGFSILQRKTGIDVEARYREALQTALTNGAALAIDKAGDLTKGRSSLDVKNQMLAVTLSYAMANAGDAIRYFGLDKDRLLEKARALLQRAVPESPPAAVAAITGEPTTASAAGFGHMSAPK